MTPDLRRTLLIDAVIVVVLVVLALVLSPGLAIVGIGALLALILCAISFVFSALRDRRRRRWMAARRRVVAGGHSPHGPSRAASAQRPTYTASRGAPGRPDTTPGRRVPPSGRAQARRKPLP